MEDWAEAEVGRKTENTMDGCISETLSGITQILSASHIDFIIGHMTHLCSAAQASRQTT